MAHPAMVELAAPVAASAVPVDDRTTAVPWTAAGGIVIITLEIATATVVVEVLVVEVLVVVDVLVVGGVLVVVVGTDAHTTRGGGVI